MGSLHWKRITGANVSKRMTVSLAASLTFLVLPNMAEAAAPRIPSIFDLKMDLATMARTGSNGRQLIISHPAFDREVIDEDGDKKMVRTQFATAGSLVNAPFDFARKVALDFGQYNQFLPQIVDAAVKPISDDRQLVRWLLDVGFSIISFEVEYTWDLRLLDNGAAIFKLTGDDNHFDESYGAYEFVRLNDKQTMVFYTTWSDIRSTSWMLAKIMDVQPAIEQSFGVAFVATVIENLRARIESEYKKTQPLAEKPAQSSAGADAPNDAPTNPCAVSP